MKKITFLILCFLLMPIVFATAQSKDNGNKLFWAALEGELENLRVLLDKGTDWRNL